MKFHLLTIFPEFFRGPLEFGVVARGVAQGLLDVETHNLRDWTYDLHKTVDDRPFGGGEGMVLKAQPLFAAVEAILPERDPGRHRVVLLSAHGPLFDQQAARRLLEFKEVLLICGRYEGVDERVSEHLARRGNLDRKFCFERRRIRRRRDSGCRLPVDSGGARQPGLFSPRVV